ncbi:hypothetical protein V6N11_009345 [Hibiscus sabdariffa]|uniref:Uncharacterized protein n=1 Tax=Hibiscus sabdariffa TaxID=183260 RepID=A0ABR2NSM0_9ROSI
MDFAHGTVTSLSGQASSGRQSLKQWHNSDIGEFTLRDASSAASMHLKQPISKSEEARRLLFRADLTVHKVVVSPMIADTIKESSEYLVFVFGNMLGEGAIMEAIRVRMRMISEKKKPPRQEMS